MSLRARLEDFVPPWLADGAGTFASGFRVVWSLALIADAFVDLVIEGSNAALPGRGTPTALPAIARSRMITRGRVETDAEHVERLIAWRELHQSRGSMAAMTREVQNYLGRTNGGEWHTVICVSRGNTWGVRREDGAYEFYDDADLGFAWDWDSVSHPERASCWSDMWIIVLPSGYEPHLAWWWASADSGLGHDASQKQVGELREIVMRWRAARTRIRGLIWSPKIVPAGYPGAGQVAFDPLPGGPLPYVPDGTWGKWSKLDANGNAVPARPKWLRFWEFERV